MAKREIYVIDGRTITVEQVKGSGGEWTVSLEGNVIGKIQYYCRSMWYGFDLNGIKDRDSEVTKEWVVRKYILPRYEFQMEWRAREAARTRSEV